MPRKRHHHEEHEEHVNHEAWVIPYADMLTLLMAMFLVLWSTGTADLEKLRAVASSFAESVGMEGPVAMASGEGIFEGTSDPQPAIEVVPPMELDPSEVAEATEALEREASQQAAYEAEQASLNQAEQVIAEGANQAGFGGSVSFRREERGLIVSIVTDDVLFVPGSAAVRPDGLAVLDSIAAALLSLDNRVAVEGHTDSIPISTSQFPSNWELSTGRASSVLRYLVDRYGFPVERISASGYADTRPAGDNANPEGRARNRRVDVAVLATQSPAPDGAPSAETSHE